MPPAEQTDAKINDLRNSILEQRVDYVLIRQQAKKQGIKASSKEIRDAVAQIKTRFPSEAAFREELRRGNLSNSEFEKNVADDIANTTLMRQTVEAKVQPPTEAQIREFFDKVQLKSKGRPTGLNQEDDQLAQNVADQLKRLSGPQVRWRMILIADPKGAPAETSRLAREKVRQVQEAIKKTDFAQVAAQYSEHEESRQRGGDMGVVAKGDLAQAAPALDRALFNLAQGKFTSSPIKTDDGHYFLKVEEKISGRELTFNDVANQLAEIVYQNEARKIYQTWIADLKSKAQIRRNM
jgi:parvulin-like peptidyl-prolyl isomerase